MIINSKLLFDMYNLFKCSIIFLIRFCSNYHQIFICMLTWYKFKNLCLRDTFCLLPVTVSVFTATRSLSQNGCGYASHNRLENCKNRGPIDTPLGWRLELPAAQHKQTRANTPKPQQLQHDGDNGTPKDEARPLASRATRTPYWRAPPPRVSRNGQKATPKAGNMPK